MKSKEQKYPYGPNARNLRRQAEQELSRIATITLAIVALLTDPSIAYAPGCRKTNSIKEQIENQYNILLEGEWNDTQLSVLKTTLDDLPPGLIQSHPGKLSQFSLNPKEDGSENASCACFTYTHEGKNLPPNNVEIGHKILENPILAHRVITHELVHAGSNQYLRATKTSEGWRLHAYLWHAEMLDEIFQKPFVEFAEEIDKKLQTQYPELYKLVQAKYAQTKDLNTIQKLPKSFGEQMTAKNMKEFNKVARWLYAVSKGPYSNMYQTMDPPKYPYEFIPVLSEWYIQGKDVFMYNMEGVISKEMAEALYALLKYQFFEGYEYTQDGKAIKPPKRPEVTPLRRGRY